MRIESYFREVQQAIESCAICRTTSIKFEKRSSHTGLVIAELTFVDGSILQVREFIDSEMTVERLMYVYHYMNASNKVIFRYDNTGHHKRLNLPTYPHHKHEGSEDHVIAAHPIELTRVLEEIEELVI